MIQKINEKIESYFRFIDSGEFFKRPFKIIYYLLGIINLIIPLLPLYHAIKSEMFEDLPGKFIFVFVLCWIILAFVSLLSFRLWVNRSEKVSLSANSGSEFVATPVFSHFIQTLGEWFGTWLGLLGFSISLISEVILGDESNFLYDMRLPFMDGGWKFVFLAPLIGFLIILTTRFLAEQSKALASIANNTKK